MKRSRWVRYGIDQLSAWLPAFLMILAALGTWWLLRSVPQLTGAAGDRPARHEPDYFMRDFSVKTFDPSGRLKSELVGIEGHHYPDTDTLEVQSPRMRSYDEGGQPTVATAKRAVSNKDGSVIELFGDAHVVRDAVAKGTGKLPKVEFRGEYLRALVDEDRVISDQPVQLSRGLDVFTGDRFEYDNDTGIALLTGRVRGLLQPKR